MSQDVARKLTLVGILGLVQTLVIVVKVRHETESSWWVCLIPALIFMAFWLGFLVVQCIRTPRKTKDPEELSRHQIMFRRIMKVFTTWVLWAVILIFLLIVAAQLTIHEADPTHIFDYSELAIVFMAYFALLLILAIIYGIITYHTAPSPKKKKGPSLIVSESLSP